MTYQELLYDALARDIRAFDGSHDLSAAALAEKLVEAGWLKPDADSPGIVYVVFDGPPSHDAPRFIEVETMDGASVRVGNWVRMTGDREGEWALQLSLHPTEAEYENALAYAEGSAQNMLTELSRAEKVNEHLLARNATLAGKLEAISKLAAEEKYKVSGDRESYSQYWEGYEFMQDLVEQIIGSPEEDA